jgi:hypothetical protein
MMVMPSKLMNTDPVFGPGSAQFRILNLIYRDFFEPALVRHDWFVL